MGCLVWERKEINLPMVSDAQTYSMPGCLVYEAYIKSFLQQVLRHS